MIKLLEDRILVRPCVVVRDEKTAGGLYVPETANGNDEFYQRGEVVAVGPGRVDVYGKVVDHGIRVDDVVIYPHRIGHDLKVDGEVLEVMRASDVHAVEEPSEEVKAKRKAKADAFVKASFANGISQ